MTPEELDTALDQYRYPELGIGDTGANVVALQTWLRMLGHYHGAVSGRLDPATAQAVDDFRAQQASSGVPLPTPPGAVLARNTWEAMNDLLQHMLPPNPDALDRRPLPHRSSFDSEAKYHKALMEGLRTFGFPVNSTVEPLRIPISVDASGFCTIHGLPPGEYEPSLSTVAPPTTGTVDLHLQASDGAPFHGRLRLASVDREYDLTATNGHAHLAGLPPGEYNLDIAHADQAEHLLSDTGSLSLHLRDAQGHPVAAVGYLASAMPDSDSLQNAVRLFKALQRGLTVGLESGHRARLGQSLLSGSFDDTAHDYHARTWARFSSTWGRFYGAPWTGILFHPSAPLAANANDDLNWGTHQLITMLQQWGRAYLLASENEADLIERLRRPIALHYLGRPLGGPIHQRRDFSQCGTDSSLHLQRVSSVIVDGLPTEVFHGGVDYLSPEYSPHLTARQLGPLLATSTSADITTPEDTLVDLLVAPQIRDAVPELIHDRRQASKTSNAKVSFLTRLTYRATGHTGRRQANRAQLLAAAAKESPNHAAIFMSADSAFFTAHQLAQFKSLLESPSQSTITPRLWKVFRCVQKALYWCKLLVSAGHHEKAREWSKRYLDRGWEGLFRAYEFIDSDDVAPDLYFEFRDHDWTNLLQLEAIVEFYTNYNDPNRPDETFPRGTPREGVSVPRLPTVNDKGDYDAFVDPQFMGSPKGLSAGLHLVQIDPFGARNNALGKIRAKSTPLRHVSGSMYSITLPKPDQSIEHALTQQPPTLALWVRSSDTRASATYRITHATKGPDNKTYQITLDTAPDENPGGSPGPQPPTIPANAPWELIETNSWLTGTNAQMHLTDRNTIVLDVTSTTINSHTDTIFLESDTARPSRTYRITEVKGPSEFVLDKRPSLQNGHSKWRIPAGLGGTMPPLEHNMTRQHNRHPTSRERVIGHDHYDGTMFIIHNGRIASRHTFTSFTSHKRPTNEIKLKEKSKNVWVPDNNNYRGTPLKEGDVNASSIRGNKIYAFDSATATGSYINFSFLLKDTNILDGCRYYSREECTTPIPEDYTRGNVHPPPGRTYDIFIHYGSDVGSSGSAGCQVSPLFYEFRKSVIIQLNTRNDSSISEIGKLDHKKSVAKHNSSDKSSFSEKWNKLCNGHYWLIRPQERALDNYDIIKNYILNQQRRRP